MKFKEWLKLQEIGTGTNMIAVFSRPVMTSRRHPADYNLGLTADIEAEDEKPKKKKKDDIDS